MKKCNFLAVLITALFMVVGFEGFSQEYVSGVKAATIVQNQVETLTKNPVTGSAHVKNANQSAQSLYMLKIKVGNALVEPLKSGNDVSGTLATVINRFRSNVPERQAIVAEVETFYKNLLKKHF